MSTFTLDPRLSQAADEFDRLAATLTTTPAARELASRREADEFDRLAAELTGQAPPSAQPDGAIAPPLVGRAGRIAVAQGIQAPGADRPPVPETPPSSGYVEDIGRGLARGIPEIERQIGGAVEAFTPFEATQEAGQRVREEAEGRMAALPAPETFPGKLAQSVPSFTASIGAGIAAAAAAPVLGAGAGVAALTGLAAGAGTAGVQSGGGEFAEVARRLQGSGLSDDQIESMARRSALTVGAVSAITNTVPIAGYLGRFAPTTLSLALRKIAGNRAGAVLLQGVAEGSQESVEDLSSMIAQDVIQGDPDAYRGFLQRLGGAAAGGAVLGAGASVALESAAAIASPSQTPTVGESVPRGTSPAQRPGVSVGAAEGPAPGAPIDQPRGTQQVRPQEAPAGSAQAGLSDADLIALARAHGVDTGRPRAAVEADLAALGVPTTQPVGVEGLAPVAVGDVPHQVEPQVAQARAQSPQQARPGGVGQQQGDGVEQQAGEVEGAVLTAPGEEGARAREDQEPGQGADPFAEEVGQAVPEGPVVEDVSGGHGGTPSPVQSDTTLRTEFESRSEEHRRVSSEIESLVTDSTLSAPGADVIREVFKGARPEFLARFSLKSGDVRDPAGNRRLGVSRDVRRLREDPGFRSQVEILKGLAAANVDPKAPRTLREADAEATVLVLHEVAGHVGYNALLSGANREVVADVYHSKTPQQWEAWFGRGMQATRGAREYAAQASPTSPGVSQEEFFAHSIADYILSKRTPHKRLEPLLARFGRLLREAIDRLRRRGAVAKLRPYFDAIIEGRSPDAPRARAPAAGLPAARSSGAAPPGTGRSTASGVPPPAPSAPPGPGAASPDATPQTERAQEVRPSGPADTRAVKPQPTLERDRGVPQPGTPWPERPAIRTEPVEGEKGEVVLPDGRRLPFVYAVVSAGDLIPTHDARRRFAVNEAGDSNERPYHDKEAGKPSRDAVARMAEDLDPSLLLTDTPTATDGPPIVTPDLRVVGGNARSMALQLAYGSARGRPGADRYAAALRERAARFGLDPARIGMQEPVLVRRLTGDPGRRGDLSRVLNEALTAGRTREADAVSRGRLLSPETADRIAEKIGESTLASALQGKSGFDIAGMLRDAGVFSAADLAQFIADGQLTKEGRLAVERTLLGSVIPDVGLMDETPASVQNMILRTAGTFLRLRQATKSPGSDLDIDRVLADALRIGALVKATKAERVDFLLEQGTLTPEPAMENRRAVALARAFEEGKPIVFAQKMRRLHEMVADALAGNMALGQTEPLSPGEAFDAAFGMAEGKGGFFGRRADAPGQGRVQGPQPATGRQRRIAEAPEARPSGARAQNGPAPANRWRVGDEFNANTEASPMHVRVVEVDGDRLLVQQLTLPGGKPQVRNGRTFEFGVSAKSLAENSDIRPPERGTVSPTLAADDGRRPDETLEEYKIRTKFREAEKNTGSLFGRAVADPSGLDPLGFHSRLARTAAAKVRQPMRRAQAKKTLLGNGVTLDELTWTGLLDLLDAKPEATLTPAALGRYLDANRVELREVVKGGGPGKTEIARETERFDREQQVALDALRQYGIGSAGTAMALEDSARAYGRGEATLDVAWDMFASRFADNARHSIEQSGARAAWRQMAQASRFINNNQLGASGAQFEQFTLPGGENYREVLLVLPERNKNIVGGTLKDILAARERGDVVMPLPQETANFRSSHFPEPNIVAHLRIKDRTTPDGRRVLFLEEVQSDWHEQGRERGYAPGDPLESTRGWTAEEIGNNLWSVRDANGRERHQLAAQSAELALEYTRRRMLRHGGRVPPAPFAKTWHEMALRRALRLAAEGGYDALGWTTGEQQIARYEGLARDVETVAYDPTTRTLNAFGASGKVLMSESGVAPERIADYVGRDAAKALLDSPQQDDPEGRFGAQPGRRHVLSDRPVRVGGAGMRSFYDRDLVHYADKFAKRFAAKIEDGKVETDEEGPAPAHILPVSPAMRESLMEEGVHLFGRGLDTSADDPAFRAVPPSRTFDTPPPAAVINAAAARIQHDRVIDPASLGAGRRPIRWALSAASRLKVIASEIRTQATERASSPDAMRERANVIAGEADRLREINVEEAARMVGLADRLRRAADAEEGTGALGGRGQAAENDAAKVETFAETIGVGYSRLSQQHENRDKAAFEEALKGLSKSQREEVGRVAFGHKDVADVPAAVKEAEARGRRVADEGEAGMKRAAALGLKRAVKGQWLPIEGSGFWMPQVPNALGREVLKEYGKRGQGPKFEAMVESAMLDHPDKTRAQIVQEIQKWASRFTRGENRYFERTRFLLPERYVELDPLKVMPRQIARNAKTVASGEVFGGFDEHNQLPVVNETLAILEQWGDPDEARAFRKFVTAELGAPLSQADRRAHENVRKALQTQNVLKLSGVFSAMQNMTQPWIGTADYGLLPRLRTYLWDFPPFIGGLLGRGRAIAHRAERAGATTNVSRFEAPENFGLRDTFDTLQDIGLFIFKKSERGTHLRTFRIAELALEKSLSDLAALEGDKGALKQWFVRLSNLGKDTRHVIERRMQRLGIGAERLAELVAGGKRLTPDELEVAGWLLVHDTQFLVNTASKPLFYVTHPYVRLLAQYKFFSARQLGLISTRMLKEAIKWNFGPLVAFALAALAARELIAILRDYLLGEDRSIAGLRDRTGAANARNLSLRALDHLKRGGVLGPLADMDFGLWSWLGGPTVGTGIALGDAFSATARNPADAAKAAGRFFFGEAPALRQFTKWWDTAWTRGRARKTWALRARAYNWLDDFRSKGPGDEVARLIRQALHGPEKFPENERSLTYRYAADAVTAGDLDDAADYLGDLIEGTPPAERKKVLGAVRQSAQSRSPLGMLSREQRVRFLSTLSEGARAEAARLDARWREDYAKALRGALQRVARERGSK